MKTIKQKEHTSFKLLNLANGDMRVTLDTGLSGINFSVPLILESEFRREVALAICPELSQPELKAVKTAEDLDWLNDDWINNEFPHLESYNVDQIIQVNAQRMGATILMCKLKSQLDQFSQPKEEQPEKIVREETDELLEVIDCTEARRSGVDMRTILEISEENTRQSKEIVGLKSEVEKAKELLMKIRAEHHRAIGGYRGSWQLENELDKFLGF